MYHQQYHASMELNVDIEPLRRWKMSKTIDAFLLHIGQQDGNDNFQVPLKALLSVEVRSEHAEE